ncbi:hypothetical protein [Variovorax paradoxus]|jgi:hypothetical protein|uniref:hypothetical protein n=2 Tax=Variovorax TaxID=34072 RepID=UPI000A52CBE9|nr:hypothetical protein [Variovorax paradoxus]UKI09601.1 hypothetical protein L3V85_07060 [Variovorax paradoxus]
MSYPGFACSAASRAGAAPINSIMATYESVLQETGRFDVVDARERSYTVIESTECLHRVSVSKCYPVIKGAVSYRLLDGTPVRRSRRGFFDTMDGMNRFFVVHAVETPEESVCR